MGFLNFILKFFAVIIGLPLTIGGFIGFWVGLYQIFSKETLMTGIIVIVASIIAFILGTYLGNYAKGEFD